MLKLCNNAWRETKRHGIGNEMKLSGKVNEMAARVQRKVLDLLSEYFESH